MAKTKSKWKMPGWMEWYRPYIQNTGGNSVEDLMNEHDANMFNNAPLAALCIAVKSQVAMLELLNNNKLL